MKLPRLLSWGATPAPASSLGLVGEKNGQVTCPDVTRGLIEQIATGSGHTRLAAQLKRRHRSRSRDDVQEAIQEAIARAHRACRGTHEGEVYTWLWRTADHYLVDRCRASERELLVASDSPTLVEVPDLEQPPDQGVLKRESKAQLRAFFESVGERLTPRQRDVLALHSRGVKRPQVARATGTSQRVVKRELERILSTARSGLLERVGRGCGNGDQLVIRLAFGLAKGTEAAQAQAHLTSCPACQALLARLESWREAAAAVLPAPAMKEAGRGLVERAVHGAGEKLGSLKQQAADGTVQLKQQTAGVYHRAMDPTPLAGVRPGAAATAIAGCLAIGGGATYCLEQGVNPIAALPGVERKAAEPESEEPPKQPAREESPAPPIVQPQTEARTEAQPAPPTDRQTPAPPQQPAPPPPPEQVFEPAAPQAEASSATPSGPRKPAPAPAGGMGEFGGP